MLDSEISSTFYKVARSVGTELGGQKIPLQVDKVLKTLGMNEAPTVGLIANTLPKVSIGDDTDNWHDDQLFPEYATLSAAHAADTTQGNNVSLTVSNGSLFREWDIWRNESTQSVFQVQNVSGTTVTADGLESGGIAAGASGDVLIRLSTAFDEGGGIPVFASTREVRYTNYIQYIVESLQVTDVGKSADDYHGGKGADFKYQGTKKEREMLNALERSFFFNGEPILGAPDTGLDDPADTTRNRGKFMGFDYYLTTYLPSGSGNLRTEEDLTYLELCEWMDSVGQFQPTKPRVIVADPNFGLALRRWDGDKVRFESGDSDATMGIYFTHILAPNGMEWPVMLNPQLRAKGTNPYHYIFAMEMSDDNFQYVYFNDHDYKREFDAQWARSTRTQVDVITQYCCFRYRLAALHGRCRYRTFS